MFDNARPKHEQRSDTEKPGKKENSGGVPVVVKNPFGMISDFSFDDVRVHYNSDKPTRQDQGSHPEHNVIQRMKMTTGKDEDGVKAVTQVDFMSFAKVREHISTSIKCLDQKVRAELLSDIKSSAGIAYVNHLYTEILTIVSHIHKHMHYTVEIDADVDIPIIEKLIKELLMKAQSEAPVIRLKEVETRGYTFSHTDMDDSVHSFLLENKLIKPDDKILIGHQTGHHSAGTAKGLSVKILSTGKAYRIGKCNHIGRGNKEYSVTDSPINSILGKRFTLT